MAYIEPTLVEDKVVTLEQKWSRDRKKTWLEVNFATELRASVWDEWLWPILQKAQTENYTLQVWYYVNEKGYKTITNVEPIPGVVGESQSGNVNGGEHFIKGVGRQQTATPSPGPTSPAKPPTQAQRPTPPLAGLTQSDRVHLCLAAAMIAWGGSMIKNKDEYFAWLQTLEQYAAQGSVGSDQREILPGFESERSEPAYQGPEYGT